MIFLVVSFFITAILYAAVGFGGGSTYNALLVVAEVDYRILPVIALVCNLIVVSGGSYRFFRAGHLNFKHILSWVFTSIPAAWLGGSLQVSEMIFVGLLGFSLLLSSFHMFFFNAGLSRYGKIQEKEKDIVSYYIIPMSIGGLLGFMAGVVGIGGGIFLAPILYFLRWGDAKSIAATCSIFILVNSLSGLVGQTIKFGNSEIISQVMPYSGLLLAVLIGGQIGSYLGATRLNVKIIRNMTAVLVLYVALRLIWRWWEMMA